MRIGERVRPPESPWNGWNITESVKVLNMKWVCINFHSGSRSIFTTFTWPEFHKYECSHAQNARKIIIQLYWYLLKFAVTVRKFRKRNGCELSVLVIGTVKQDTGAKTFWHKTETVGQKHWQASVRNSWKLSSKTILAVVGHRMFSTIFWIDSNLSKRKPVRTIHKKHTNNWRCWVDMYWVGDVGMFLLCAFCRIENLTKDNFPWMFPREHREHASAQNWTFLFRFGMTSFYHSRHHLLEHFSNRCRLRRLELFFDASKSWQTFYPSLFIENEKQLLQELDSHSVEDKSQINWFTSPHYRSYIGHAIIIEWFTVRNIHLFWCFTWAI